MNLFESIRKNDLQSVNERINQYYADSSFSPINTAIIHKSSLSIVKELLKADQNQPIVKGCAETNSLILSCQNEYLEVFKELIKQGNDVNCHGVDGQPLLLLACEKGFSYVKVLLENGADPNVVDSEGNSPYHAAMLTNSEDKDQIISILLKYQSNPLIKDKNGLTAEEFAMSTQCCPDKFKQPICNIKGFTQRSKRRRLSKMNLNDNAESSENMLITKIEEYTSVSRRYHSCRKTYKTLERKLFALKEEIKLSNLKNISLCKEISKLIKDQETHKNDSSLWKHSGTIFECPICFLEYVPGKEIYQCPHGHLICAQCKNATCFVFCPQCRCSMDNVIIRNRALEELVVCKQKNLISQS